ncbi:MAG: sigma-54-dependent Fis family transcriptional regulator [Planctomycetota bacterium]|nr:MAG: sigma-54-dependent Fis family transcriptional regulator [Planctomycetota bacterium]
MTLEPDRRRSPPPVVKSAAMRALFKQASRIARTDEPVLLLGETGAGKGVLARAIQASSLRADRPMLDLNCAALPESLIESELFGYEPGAFTGARGRKKGLLELVDGGTLLMDEVGELPLLLQSKFLQVLESGRFLPVGGSQYLETDFRLIAATNRNIHKAKDEGSFRLDLYFRLSVFVLELPPLRERMEELPDLIRAFLEEVDSGLSIAPEALERLCCHRWPGNVRELRNVIRHAALLCEGKQIGISDLPPWLIESCPRQDILNGGSWKDKVRCFESQLLASELEKHGGDIDATTRKLGISRSSLYRKIQQHEAEEEGPPADADLR